MSEVAAMLSILLAGCFLAALVSADVKRYQSREKDALDWHARIESEKIAQDKEKS